jgi:protein ImuA
MPRIVDPSPEPARQQLVEALRRQIAHGQRTPGPEEAPVSSGFRTLDELLPDGGFHRGTLVEWLAAGDGCGEASLALTAAREACRQGGALVVLDRAGEFYPPAVIGLGIEPGELLVVQTVSEADHAWALDQTLRCPAVAAVVAWPERLDAKTFRRLQLAAEQGGALGLLIRPEQVRHEPSWADVRLWVEPIAPPLSHFGKGESISIAEGRNPVGWVESASPTRICENSIAEARDSVGWVESANPTRICDNSMEGPAEPPAHQRTVDRRLRVQLLRGRGGASGGSVEVEIGNETRTVHLDSQLAHPTNRRRAARA